MLLPYSAAFPPVWVEKKCPECGDEFSAHEGVIYPWKVEDNETGEISVQYVLFCSADCMLEKAWPTICPMGTA